MLNNFNSTASDAIPVYVALPQGVLFGILTYCLYNLFFHPLAKVPGPLTARLGLPWFRVYATITRSYAWRLQRVHEKYGPLVRIGPNFVSTIDPECVNELYAHGSNFHKTEFYLSFASIKTSPSLFADIDPQSHAARRRSVAHVYSMKHLVDLERFVDPVVDQLLERMDETIALSKRTEGSNRVASVPLDELLSYFAADAVGELAFGETFGLLKSGDSTLLLPSARNLQRLGSIAGSLPRLAPILKPLLWQLSAKVSPAAIARETLKRVDARYKAIEDGGFYDMNGAPQRRDMLTGFIESKNSLTKKIFTKTEVMSNATTVFGAGSDTTSVSMSAFFYYILKNPPIYARLMEELDEAINSGSIAKVPVSYADGTKLEYFQACMKEAMRLITPVGMEMPRYVSSGGMLVEGKYFLPEGTEIGVSPFTYHRAKAAYGDDAGAFRPERWLGITDEEKSRLERNNLVFGAGSRICIGRNVSLMEMTKLLPTLLLRYSFSFTPRKFGSPHRRPLGRGCSGVESADEPLWLDSAWFCEISDFWVDARVREN